ncbi:hypothetical protein ON010_g16393 [Phytophthora cinnamomi]|nr:hypothetical protein ON010_g16393 [Phytophthora cinnamomi]
MCVQQSSPVNQTVIVDNADTVSVLRRLVVVSEANGCPSAMQILANPTTNVFVCLEFGIAREAFQAQKYVIDVMSTTEAFYNHDTPGWFTWPINLKADPEAPSVFVSVRYPIVPIVALHVLTNVGSNSIYSACEALAPAGEWETPGFVLKSAGAVAASDTTDAVVCVKRPKADTNEAFSVLVDLAVVLSTEACPLAVDSANTTEVVVGHVKLCAEWGLVEFSDSDSDNASISFVADLSLYQTTEGEAVDTNISTSIPGNWQLIGDENSGSLHTFFLARKFEPLNLTLDETVSLQTGDEVVVSSVEAIVVPSASNELSFRVLQIADLHLTSNPDYPCLSGPTGPIRDSILESAWNISRDLKTRAGIATSDNKADDPHYNECREALTIAFLEELLDIEKPDFVVFSGDNVHTSDTTTDALAMGIFTERVENRRIPWTAVFGNHDIDGGLSREAMLSLLVEGQQFSHMKYGPREIGGVGNYEVSVVAPTDGPWGTRGSTVFRMYFLDSHGSVDRNMHPLVTDTHYEWITESQLQFYRELAASHANNSDSVPAVMYFHIPIPEYALVSPSTRSGGKNEEPASSKVNSGLFSVLVDVGDVKATCAMVAVLGSEGLMDRATLNGGRECLSGLTTPTRRAHCAAGSEYCKGTFGHRSIQRTTYTTSDSRPRSDSIAASIPAPRTLTPSDPADACENGKVTLSMAPLSSSEHS